MNARGLIDALDRFAGVLPAVVRDVAEADARWRPESGFWSILEIVRHLGDEEVEDFRTRVRLTLEDPSQPWPPIDPEGWAIQRNYNEDDLGEAVDRFVRERRASVEWLRTLDSPDWSNTYQHPKFGPMPAGMLMASWTAHDALHLRQIAKRIYQMAGRDAGEYSLDYAGEWRA